MVFSRRHAILRRFVVIFLVTQKHAYTMRIVQQLVPELRDLFQVLPYSALDASGLPKGARHFVFADVERLSPEKAEQVAELWGKRGGSEALRALNHPTRSLRRYELLRLLYERQVNDYNVYRVNELRPPERFPVFLREENEHRGPMSELLDDATALSHALQQADKAGKARDNKLIVEYRDVRDSAGMAHKYSAFRVGSHIVPRHRFASRGWCIKDPDEIGPKERQLEREYLEANPHAQQLMQLFRMARIEYGRIDYSVSDGRLLVWEINTNPMVFREHHFSDPARAETHKQARDALVEAWRAFANS